MKAPWNILLLLQQETMSMNILDRFIVVQYNKTTSPHSRVV